ncbi:class I SAM-dependent methyltransferase [Paenibacillus donghaensis]|uniref:class I SAM-dependent methyltransferase n=1 Tax=Paenibacillus donghaensis TaxID=414771 RepID=UPI001883B3F8|nr:class I SAM-dependent methyltransferase [Paenibacillus donghaensis]MBE9915649.1 class I SAM-dependent methyltransferase [Paenibacillus donghaensis]
MKNKRKEEEEKIKNFDLLASDWDQKIPEKSIKYADHLIKRLNITDEHSLLDVAAGTGIIFSRLQCFDIYLQRYVAVDISNNMLKELKAKYPNAESFCADFEDEFSMNYWFDFVIIFDSIPHFNNFDMVFLNAYKNLKNNGKFIIVHARTRHELKEHHKRIGYVGKIDPIPSDDKLIELSNKYQFRNVCIEDEDYFCYIGEK